MTVKRTVAFSKQSTNLFFHILTACNLTCRHCYINPEQHGRDKLPLAVIRKWLSAFAPQSRAANLIFLGGEPTLHPDLDRAVKFARELEFRSITIDTNGYLFNDILSKVSPNEVDYFSFSLDGATHSTNDAIRGKGSYDHCLAGLRAAKSRGFSTSLIYTVSRANIHELEAMAPLAADLDIDRFFIQVVGLRGRSACPDPSSPEDRQVSCREWLDVVPAAAHRIAQSNIPVIYPKVFLAPTEPFECAGLVADNYFVFPNGRVYRCPLCEDYPIHSFEFRDDRLVPTSKLNEADFFQLNIPEGCVMNKLIQPRNLSYSESGEPECKIACCMLKEEVVPG
jgi:MoaA/NifB/PqqE/SkfB family radical SAM enzyme